MRYTPIRDAAGTLLGLSRVALDLGGDRMIAVSAPGAGGRPRFELPGTAEKPVPHLAYNPETFLGKLIGVLIA